MNTGSSMFMLVGGSVFLIFFGLPLIISPMTWGRRIGWNIPAETGLANYLGRSLGGVIVPIIIMCFLAARNPWEYRVVFELVILIHIAMVLVHLHGFIRKTQPLIEHLEILLYAGFGLLTWYFYPLPPVF